MKTVYSTHREVCHAYAYADKNEYGRASNIFYKNDTIYSYGHHFPMAKKVRNKAGNVEFILFNGNGYSNSTAKHQSHLRSALYQETLTVYTGVDNFNPLLEIKYLMQSCKNLSYDFNHATARGNSFEHKKSLILSECNKIAKIANYYRVRSKLPSLAKKLITVNNDEIYRLLKLDIKREDRLITAYGLNAEKRALLAEKRRLNKIKKDKIERAESIEDWRNHERSYIALPSFYGDMLRLSKDGLFIETSQGISISLIEAKRAFLLYENKKIVGTLIDNQFKVIASNGILKVGCHNIEKSEIIAISKYL